MSDDNTLREEASMPRDDDKSVSDQNTFDGNAQQDLDAKSQDAKSLGDEATCAGGGSDSDTSANSLGDEVTFAGGGVSDDDLYDDGMEVQDLEARYKIERALGKGGMGEVLLATDMRLGRQVAIKRMLGNAARNKTAVSRFLTEAQSIAALNHPNIVQIYDYGRAKDGPFLIMEFVEGSSLLDRCREGAIPAEEAIELTCQLCDGLSKAHEVNIIHRDIKPANVLLTTDGVPKLTDFGLAKDEAADTGMTMAGAVLGTLDFMPPEQRRDAALTDARSDLWSLAATLYQMVTGKSPKIIKLNDVPKSLQEVLGKTLEDSKEDRYQTAVEMGEALKACLTSAEPVFDPMEELGAGECSKCHSRNDSSRKFCRECAASLRVSCLACESEIPVWDKVCGECGANQPDLIAARLSDLQQQRDQAEELRGSYGYENALQLAEKVAAVEDQRLSQHKPWADEFLESTKAEWQREQESSRQHFVEAMKHWKAFDYESAIHAIQSIPEPMRSTEVSSFLQRLESDHQESHGLIHTIEDRIKRRELDGLLSQVDRAVKLQGNREDLLKLQGQLRDRETKLTSQRDDAYAKAKELVKEGKAKAALELLKGVRCVELTNSQYALKRDIEAMVASETELTAMVKEAKAVGVIEPAEVVVLLPKAVECLALNPNHAAIRKLRDDLLMRLHQCTGEVLALLPPEVLSKLPSEVRSKVFSQNSIGMKFHLLPAGEFKMGASDKDCRVTLTKPFQLGVYPVTQEQYRRVMRKDPSNFKGSQNPVEKVSWKDAMEFCRRLSGLPEEKAAGRVYRLPTEASSRSLAREGRCQSDSGCKVPRKLSTPCALHFGR